MWKSRMFAALGAPVAAALLAGFAQGPVPTPQNDPCLLVAKPEMARIVGKPVALATTVVDDAGPRCNYGVTRDGPFIRLSRLRGDWYAMVAALSDGVTVAGLGTGAVWSARDYALLVQAPNGEILRVSLDDQERSLRGGDLKDVAVDVARAALKNVNK